MYIVCLACQAHVSAFSKFVGLTSEVHMSVRMLFSHKEANGYMYRVDISC